MNSNSNSNTMTFIDLVEIVQKLQQQVAPIGSVVAFVGTNPPQDWIICDGSALSRTLYPDLYSVIGTNYGAGFDLNGNKVVNCDFNVPDFRGYFLRGMDSSGKNRDPDSTQRVSLYTGGNTGTNLGSIQSDSFASHNHGITDTGHSHGFNIPNGESFTVSYPNWGTGTALVRAGSGTNGPNAPAHWLGISGSLTGITINNNGSNETRPKNVNVNWIIRCK